MRGESALQRAQARPEEVGRRGRRRIEQPALPRVSETCRRNDVVAQLASLPAAAHEAPQALLQGRVSQRTSQGSITASVAFERGAAAGGQRDVGRHVVALVAAVQPGQQRRVARGEAGGQAVARVDATDLDARAAVEQVGLAVAVVVDRVAPLPGHHRQHDEHAAAVLGLDRERHGAACARRADRAAGRRPSARPGRCRRSRAPRLAPALERRAGRRRGAAPRPRLLPRVDRRTRARADGTGSAGGWTPR